MAGPLVYLMAFLAGLTLCGVSGSVLELAFGARLGFRAPFVSPRLIWLSLGVTVLAGPFMLVNEALAAIRDRRAGLAMLMAAVCAAVIWHIAAGILLIELALGVGLLSV